MRDNHQKMPEILETFEEGENAFAIVAVEREDQVVKFQIGITQLGYRALRKMFQFHPFEQSPGAKYRYFFAGWVSHQKPSDYRMGIRVESGNVGKQFDFEAPKELIQNLKWFFETKDLSKAAKLRVN